MNGRHFPFLLYWEHKRAREENQEEKENMSILEVNHLKKIYTTRFSGNQVQALSNLSFSVEEGEYVAIMGESGSGKTTLLNILAALDKPTGGEVLLNGKNIVEINEKEISAFRRENLGFVFQDFNLLDNFSLKDNILLPLVLSGVRYPEMEKRLHPITKRLGIEEGVPCKEPIFEICYKCDELNDPLINDTHAIAMGIATREELNRVWELTAQINQLLIKLFDSVGVRLIDFKIEFGKDADGNIMLADEISPDSCRLWDKDTNEKLDKDRFRREMGNVEEAYIEICKRLTKEEA